MEQNTKVDQERMKRSLKKLGEWKKESNDLLEKEFKIYTKRAKEIHPEASRMVEYLRRFSMRGGKRIRPGLIVAGYKAVDGNNHGKITKAAISIEAFQTYVLIHDDVEDEDDERRGGPTMHKMYEKLYEEENMIGGKEKYGRNIAITAGSLAGSYSIDTLAKTDFDPETKVKAIRKLEQIHRYTAAGQTLDHTINHRRIEEVTEKDVLKIHELKTAQYTIAGPLELGAILGKGTKEQIQTLREFGVKAGKAFQTYDDLLGLYGTKEKLGKPVDSDLKEGKKTLLILKAMENGNEEQRRKIKQTLGNKNITQKQVEEIRKIVKETGSYEYSKKRVSKMIEESKEALRKSNNIDPEIKDFLLGIADYIITREV
ncbi:MAG: polyprenyl synthetase family protein [archaeon]